MLLAVAYSANVGGTTTIIGKSSAFQKVQIVQCFILKPSNFGYCVCEGGG